MGIIRRQSIQYSIISYLGFGIGAINMLLLFPNFLSQEQIGLISVFSAIGFPLALLSNVGSIHAINKFLPYYKAHTLPKNSDLFTWVFLVSLAGFCVVISIVWLNKPFIFSFFTKSPLLVDYFYLLPIFTFGYLIYSILMAFNNGYFYTVWVSFVSEVFFRLFNTLMILFIIFGFLDFDSMFRTYIFVFWVGALLYLINLIRKRKLYITFKVSQITGKIKRNILQYSSFFWLASMFSILATFIDTIVLAGLQGLDKSGMLMIATYFITLTVVPQRSMISVSVPVIAESWRKNDMKNLDSVYKKSANNMLWAGGFIYLVILLNLNDLLSYLPETYHGIKWVIVILGIAKIVDYATGVNQNIIALSKSHWRMDLYSNIILVCMLIPLNYFLIKNYSIIGSAWANLIAFFVYNSAKTIYLWYFLRISPFNRQNIKLLILMAFLIAIFGSFLYYSKISDYAFFTNAFNIALRSIVFAIVFIIIMIKLNISDDFRGLLKPYLKWL